MPLRPETFALTALLSMLTAMNPLSIDMYLPSLPILTQELGATPAEGQLTLSIFLAGFAVGQIFYGPLSDRYGRKPLLLAGLVIFAAASVICASVTSIEGLIAARFLQAVGGSGPVVLARSMVRDFYSGPRAGQELARMGVIMGVVPAGAPLLGGLLENLFGWRASFILIFVIACLLLGVVWAKLPETVREKRREPITLLSIFNGYRFLLLSAAYRGYVALTSIAFAGLFAYISASSFVLQGIYGLDEFHFALMFAMAVLGFVVGGFIGSKVVRKIGIDGAIRLGSWFLAAGGILMLLAVILGPGHPLEVTLPITIYLVGIGLVMPQALAGAMQPFPDRAGSASSLSGLLQMTTASIAGVGIGHVIGETVLPVALAIAGLGLLALVIERVSRRARADALII
ncbi:Bcr/CflA family drug resistance efflux transporter [Agaricicola taiwanensis]|uniref:Bcr/CflA family efflux transporter n=1 Tax=Agaricicola taiwanensis TaxID=591372 RepID=A0A8J2VL80_9RHOB|nr:multidrug effflux MFS transporter [Agaricicola taiwanensis]GGE29913.1 Bcr/CflA family drug resistance efflux transporter [Agaricicola taiwanensis]